MSKATYSAYDIDCFQYNRPGSNVSNFKLPFCSLLASTDMNHKETKLLPRSAADSNCLLLVNITGITTLNKGHFTNCTNWYCNTQWLFLMFCVSV